MSRAILDAQVYLKLLADPVDSLLGGVDVDHATR